METPVDAVVRLLDLEQLEVNLFRGVGQDTGHERIYGGEVLAQALMAAGRTVPADRAVHSMHSYFLRIGDPSIPVVYDVDRIRDGRSFTTRRVVAIQRGQAIFNLAASFQVHEEGPEHHDAMPDVPAPEDLPPAIDWSSPMLESVNRQVMPHAVAAFEWRAPSGEMYLPGAPGGGLPRPPDQDIWMRADGTLPDDPMLHACVVAYASDLTLLSTVTLPHKVTGPSNDFMVASLDHVMWFHRPFRADEWLLFNVHSPSASAARGFANGSIFRRDGTLAVTIAQEGLFRPIG